MLKYNYHVSWQDNRLQAKKTHTTLEDWKDELWRSVIDQYIDSAKEAITSDCENAFDTDLLETMEISAEKIIARSLHCDKACSHCGHMIRECDVICQHGDHALCSAIAHQSRKCSTCGMSTFSGCTCNGPPIAKRPSTRNKLGPWRLIVSVTYSMMTTDPTMTESDVKRVTIIGASDLLRRLSG